MNENTPRDVATAAADLAADGKAFGIIVLDLHEVSSVADYFVLASAHSHIQVESVCERIAQGIEDRLGTRPISVEGLENAQWALLDYGSVVVHVFQQSVRELYDLERLWSHAPRHKLAQEHEETPARPAARKDNSDTKRSGHEGERPKRSARV